MPYADPERQKAAVRRWIDQNREKARALWRKHNKRRAPRPKRKHTLEDMDSQARRCLWHFFHADGGCRRKARWRNGQWRACSLHKLPDDVPILATLRKAW